jgi:hypothetical protein
MTEPQRQRVQQGWERIAKGILEITQIGNFVYAFGTEVGVRRLSHAFKSFEIGESKNLGGWAGCWYFRKELAADFATCEHKHQKWNVFMTSGTCQDCGAHLTSDKDGKLVAVQQ